ncbi:MAG TPA: hypothetical protein VMW53_00075 [archaeon]|nr:hypothetical protein [archaeon]
MRITGAIKTPPDWSKVVNLIEELIENIKKIEKNPIETSIDI